MTFDQFQNLILGDLGKRSAAELSESEKNTLRSAYKVLAIELEALGGLNTLSSSILGEVSAERARQDAKWGEQNHHPAVWLSILGEEYGEVCKAVCEAHLPGYPSFGDWRPYREELIQVAAVAVAMAECLDRGAP